MIDRKRALIVLLIIIGLPLLFAAPGWGDLTRWAVRSSYSAGSMRADPASYGANPAPSGDWLIVIDGRSSLARPLTDYLKIALPRITPGASAVRTTRTLPLAGGCNVVWVELKPMAFWTPYYAYIGDQAKVIVTTGSVQPGPLPETAARSITPGNIAVEIRYESNGHGVGLVGRARMNAHRAQLIGDMVVKAITNAYRNAVR